MRVVEWISKIKIIWKNGILEYFIHSNRVHQLMKGANNIKLLK
jgi:hypothetical protein